MGFISRKVVPTCASICVFCPALRTRSRLPVKRHKKLLADVFQEEFPNDRRISKLCDYAVKNPLRLPKITENLEQRGYKAIRNEQLGPIAIVVAVYIKFFSSCKDQMPLFAVSAITMIQALLDQNRQDDMCVFGCTMLFEFAYNQVDGTYFYQLDGLTPVLCSFARVIGEEQKQRQLRSAGLRALSALIWFMGEHSQMLSNYNFVVSVVMENYGHPFVISHDNASVVEIPSVWAQLCVEKISQCCKEASTTRRFLEPLLIYFDVGKHWSSKQGLASTVLQQIVHFVESFGNDCFLVAVLVRHLDHRNLSQKIDIKTDVIRAITCLVQQSKSKATAMEIGVLSDMLRHLRNTLQASSERAVHLKLDAQLKLDLHKDLQLAIQDFLAELVKKLGDLTPIFEIMAVTLETLPSVTMASQSTIQSLLILGSILSLQPALKATYQGFPEALLQQLALALVHSDSNSRIGAHKIFEVILLSLTNAEETIDKPTVSEASTRAADMPSVSDASTRAADKIPSGSASAFDVAKVYSRFKREAESNLEHGSQPNNKKNDKTAKQLSEDQVSLVFSSLWSESILDNNVPANFEANYWTFTLTLLFSPARVSKPILTWAFQLPLSLRTISFDKNGSVSPSRQRSLLMLSSAMLAFASEFYSISGIRDHITALLKRGQIDPYLELEGSGLRVTNGMDGNFGTPADNATASSNLDLIRKEVDLSNEPIVSSILSSLSTSSEVDLDLSCLREDLLSPFTPVNDEPNRGRSWTAVLRKSASFDAVVESEGKFSNDILHTDPPKAFMKSPFHTPSADVIGATQLVESALEISGQIAASRAAVSPLPFSDLATKCEEFHSKTKKKTNVWANIDGSNQRLPWTRSSNLELVKVDDTAEKRDHAIDSSSLMRAPQGLPDKPWQILQLPPASHYDNFLQAAGWLLIQGSSPTRQSVS